MCKSWCEAILAIIAIVIGLIPMSAMVYKWTLVVLGIVLLIHSFTCKSCFAGNGMDMKASRRK